MTSSRPLEADARRTAALSQRSVTSRSLALVVSGGLAALLGCSTGSDAPGVVEAAQPLEAERAAAARSRASYAYPRQPWPAGCVDEDRDFWPTCAEGVDRSFDNDCDDRAGSVFPGNSETCDGVDNDCDRQIDESLRCASRVAVPGRRLDARPLPWPTGCVDQDQDGWPVCGEEIGSLGDCQDDDPQIKPFATEACNGFDDDCDRLIDEGCDR